MLGQHARIFLINFTETDRCSFACGKTLPRSDVVIVKGTSWVEFDKIDESLENIDCTVKPFVK